MYEKESAPFMRPVDPILDQCPVGMNFFRLVKCGIIRVL